MGFLDLFRSEEEKREVQDRRAAELRKRRDESERVFKEKIGNETVRVSSNRVIHPLVEEGEKFPCGVKGMIPIVTEYKGGVEHLCFGFAIEGDRKEMMNLIAQVNDVLDRASELSGHEFGMIDYLEFNMKDPCGWGFTRVDYAPLTRSGGVSKTPLRARFETSAVPCSEGSYSGLLDLKRDGSVAKIEVTEWSLNSSAYKVIASMLKGAIVVKSATKLGKRPSEGMILYSRD